VPQTADAPTSNTAPVGAPLLIQISALVPSQTNDLTPVNVTGPDSQEGQANSANAQLGTGVGGGVKYFLS
jgi:hypothetical protein